MGSSPSWVDRMMVESGSSTLTGILASRTLAKDVLMPKKCPELPVSIIACLEGGEEPSAVLE